MIPLKVDLRRTSFALINVLLIAVNVAVFLYQFSLPLRAGEELVYTFGLIPSHAQAFLLGHNITLAQAFVPIITSMFLHGGWMHLLGNMLFLWVFGGNVEDEIGHLQYLGFYFVSGIGAALVHTIFNWGSNMPTIGASGAISGVMGAFIVLFPRARVLTLIPLIVFFFTVRLPAFVMLGYWFLLQVLSGVGSFGAANQGGVAWWAHVGGFLLGAAIVWSARERRYAHY